MFVKLYRYKIKSADLDKCKKNADDVWKIYSSNCKLEYKLLIKKKVLESEIIELGFYRSKTDWLDVMRKLNKNRKLNLLFKEFLKIAINGEFEEEEFEAL